MKKILVVEDNLDNRNLLSLYLGAPSYQVEVAEDGIVALQLLDSGVFDLVLLDINMPGMDGYEVLERMKQHEQWRNIPVIMLTGVNEKEPVIRCLTLGADNYIVKPYDTDELKARINDVLNKYDRQASATKGHQPVDTDFKSLLKRLQKGEFRLPTLPDVAFKMVNLLEKENVSLDEIAEIIKVDPAISAAVIKIANSAYYQGVSEVNQVEDALTRLGLKQINQSLMPILTAGMFNVESALFQNLINQVWQHALATGIYARLIAHAVGHQRPEMLFTLGMFHDVGKLFLVDVLHELSANRTFDELQILTLFDQLHVSFGSSLVKRWELPKLFVDVIEQHHNIDKFSELIKEIQIISLADRMAYLEKSENTTALERNHMEQLGLDVDSMKQIMEAASEEITAAHAAV